MTHRGLLWVAGLTAVLVICAVAVPQEDMLSMAKVKSALKLSLSNMRYGQPTLPEGHVDEADRLKANENEMFTVTSEQEKNLYLKGYSGGRYIDGCWKPLSNADYSGEYSGMLKWLAKLNFHPLTQAAEYYALSDAEQEDIPETNELQMNVAGAYRYPVYAPASLYQAKGRHAKYKKDAEMISKGIVGARHYTLDEISNAKPSELMIAQNWVSDPQNEAQKQYVQAEAVYREFVYDHYLTVDADLAETVQHIFWDDYDETNDGIYSAVCQIRNKLEGTVFYTYEPKKPPQGEDPLLTAGGQGGGQSSKAVEVVKDVEAIVLGIVVIFILLVIFFIIALELHRIVIIRRKGKHLKNASQEERVIEIEKRIFLMMNFRGIEARLGWKTEETDQCLAERFEWAEQGDYARVCSILEKVVYGGCELEAYEMRTLYYFLEKISAADTTDDWKIRIKMRYAC